MFRKPTPTATAARTDGDGRLIPLPEQDRTRWTRELVEEGQQLVRVCLRQDAPGPYQIQAAINAVHSDAADTASTQWGQILALYDQLQEFDPSPVVALNRAVAVAELDGPAAALALVDDLPLTAHHLFHAVRADLPTRTGRVDEAASAYDAAIARTANQSEQTLLRQRLHALRAQ